MYKKEILDTILIGQNPSIYMASIYIQTYNMKQMVIKEENEESKDFVGFELVPGVLDIKSKDELTDKLEKQCSHLGVNVLDDKVVSIEFDSVFKVKCGESTYLARSVVVDSKKYNLTEDGFFNSLENIQSKEAIEMLANGCKVSFAVREYVKQFN